MGNIHSGEDVKKTFMHGRTTEDGQRPITIAHLEPLAQVS